MNPKYVKKYSIIQLLLIVFSIPIYSRAMGISDARDGTTPGTRTLYSFHMSYPWSFDMSINKYLGGSDFDIEGVNIGPRFGNREIRFLVEYGRFGSLGRAFTTGESIGLTLGFVFNGNRVLPNGPYVGMEIEQAFFGISAIGGVQHCLIEKRNFVPYLGIGLKF